MKIFEGLLQFEAGYLLNSIEGIVLEVVHGFFSKSALTFNAEGAFNQLGGVFSICILNCCL